MLGILSILFKIILILVFLIFILFIIMENRDFEVNEINIWMDNLPEGFDKYRICHLSDMHNKIWGDKLINRIKESKVDIVVITGDIVERKKNFQEMIDQIRKINKICQVYYVSGNHEVWCNKLDDIKAEFKKMGVKVLDNDCIFLNNKGDKVMLFGLSDPDNYGFYLSEEKSEKIFNKKIPEIIGNYNGVKILLSHRPNFLDIFEKYKIDLILSGHTHGGQFHLPFYGAIYASNQGFFPKYSDGYYKKGNSQMIISKGMHSSMRTFRINCPKEMIVVNLLRK